MIQWIFCLLPLIAGYAQGYTDPEIEELLTSVSDPCHPTLEDYRLIEQYYQHGKRPYLDHLKRCTHNVDGDIDFRIQQLRNLKLVGPNGEMPVLNVYSSNVTEETKDRCIIIYSSYNGHYPEMARRLCEELKECGYSGHILWRCGGIPNVAAGGVGLIASPYAWRIHLFEEARQMGFTQILYMDAAVHPLCDLSAVFDAMKRDGWFGGCIPQGWAVDNFLEYFKRLGIPVGFRQQVPWVYSYVIGLNFKHEKASRLFEAWNWHMHRIEDFCSLGDDVFFTCLVWWLGLDAPFALSQVIGNYDLPPLPGSYPTSLLMYQDNNKVWMRWGWGLL